MDSCAIPKRIHDDLIDMVGVLEERHPPGFPCDRNGMRLGLAAIQDEYADAWLQWEANKRVLHLRQSTIGLRDELLQVAAVALMMVKGIDAAHPWKDPSEM